MSEELTREELLRQRLVEIAQRRVPALAVEAVVRTALSASGEDATLTLRQALLALREAVRKYYSSLPSSATLSAWDSTSAPLPAESLEAEDLGRACAAALRELEEDSPAASRYLRQLSAGASSDEVAGRVKISREILYQRLFRGRNELDRLLVVMGVRT
jgi:hypothetical protein